MNSSKSNKQTSKCFVINLSVTLVAPYLIHGNEPSKYGLDAVLLRDHRGIPIISGSLLVGRITETWKAIGNQIDSPNSSKWFGSQGMYANKSKRAKIMIDDLVLTEIDDKPFDNQIYTSHRIRIDDISGTAKDGHLLMVEQVALAGAKLRFVGKWRVWATDAEIKKLIPQLKAALITQTQLGAYRSVGFGRVDDVFVDYKVAAKDNKNLFKDSNTAKIHRLAISTNQLICVASKSRRGNVFESDSIITGATILGTLATMLASKHGVPHIGELTDKSSLAKSFSNIRCTHALPTKSGGSRPVPLPQSLLSMDDKIVDAWQCDTPPKELTELPKFQTDWKGADFNKAEQASKQDWGQLRKHLKVRTSIDNLGKAKEGSLFAYECFYSPFATSIAPIADDSQNRHSLEPATQWQFDLDLRQLDADEYEHVVNELNDLLACGLLPVGKTDAVMTVSNVDTETLIKNKPSINMDDTFVDGDCALIPIMLVTDMLLFNTDSVLKLTNDPSKLLDVYQNSFKELIEQSKNELKEELNIELPDCIRLHHYFATQKMVGGDYYYQRFQKNNERFKGYQPWVMTEAGSVFVMSVNTKHKKDAQSILTQWQDYGLSLPKSVADAYGNTWDKNPFIKQNGYGEVVVNPQKYMGFKPLSL